MTASRIDLTCNRIARLKDLSDLAEMLFPANRNHQLAFLAVWISIKWSPTGMVPNLASAVQPYDVSRRTLERVRAKMRRLGLIDHVSRFNARHGYREGWILSSRFEKSLRQLADKVDELEQQDGSKDKEMLLLEFAEARLMASKQDNVHDQESGGEEDVQLDVEKTRHKRFEQRNGIQQ